MLSGASATAPLRRTATKKRPGAEYWSNQDALVGGRPTKPLSESHWLTAAASSAAQGGGDDRPDVDLLDEGATAAWGRAGVLRAAAAATDHRWARRIMTCVARSSASSSALETAGRRASADPGKGMSAP
jgi:hypothetical protein